jgi:hypothetical protein
MPSARYGNTWRPENEARETRHRDRSESPTEDRNQLSASHYIGRTCVVRYDLYVPRGDRAIETATEAVVDAVARRQDRHHRYQTAYTSKNQEKAFVVTGNASMIHTSVKINTVTGAVMDVACNLTEEVQDKRCLHGA